MPITVEGGISIGGGINIAVVQGNADPNLNTGTDAGLLKVNAKVYKEWRLYRETHNKSWHNGLYIAVMGK